MKRSSIHLPGELIELILSKCPVKSLFRFKSVSKSWYSTISNPRFSRILKYKFFIWERPWLACNGTFLPDDGLNLISLEEDGKFRRDPVSGIPSPKKFHYMYPSNGLILLQEESRVNSFILWNPLIGKHIVIPPFNPITHPQAFRAGDLDPNNPNRFTVDMNDFYYDSATDDYKILTAYDHRYAVYSCKSESWDWKYFPEYINLSYFDYCCCDGCFYLNWFHEIKYFDTRDGEEKILMLPNDVKTLKGVRLFEVSGRLCLHELSEDGRRLQLWMLEKNGSFENPWRKLIVNMEKEEGDLYNLYPMCLSNEGFVFIRCRVREEDDNGKLKYFMYNPLDKSFHEYEFDWRLGIHYYSYSETLYMPSSNE